MGRDFWNRGARGGFGFRCLLGLPQGTVSVPEHGAKLLRQNEHMTFGGLISDKLVVCSIDNEMSVYLPMIYMKIQ
jgi:hypothetical protein